MGVILTESFPARKGPSGNHPGKGLKGKQALEELAVFADAEFHTVAAAG